MSRTILPAFLTALLALAWPGGRASAEGEREVRRNAVVRVVEKARPAAVAIHTEQIVSPTGIFDLPEELLPELPPRTGLGSGTVFHPGGYVITNAHVIARASKILLDLTDSSGQTVQREGRTVALDLAYDLAIVRIVPKDESAARETWPHLPLGRSNDLMVGETVIAVGTPFNLGLTATTGIVSGLNRRINLGADDGPVFEDFIQIDAAVNPGNSGGPLFDVTGRWIGVTTAILNRRMGAEGIGFAIPSDRVRSLVARAFSRRMVSGEWLGLEEEEGPDGSATVGLIFPKGPARTAGLRKGDRIVAVNGRSIDTLFDYRLATADLAPGAQVSLGLVRDGRPLPAPAVVTLESVPTDTLSYEHLGILVREVDEETSRRTRIPMGSGVLVQEVRPGGPADRIGVKQWDLLVALGGEGLGDRSIQNSDKLLLFLQYVRPGDVVEVTVRRAVTMGGRRYWKELPSGRLVAE